MLRYFKTRKRSQPCRQRQQRRLLCEGLERRELMAADWFVATTGNDVTGNGSLAAPFASLAKALSVTDAGDSVVLRGGNYAGGVNVSDANVTIKSYPVNGR